MDKTLKVIIISVIVLSFIWSIVYVIVRYNNEKKLINNSLNVREIYYV